MGIMIEVDTNAHKELAIWAANCAEHVLFQFEEYCFNDTRVKDAIEAARSWSAGDLKVPEARKFAFAAHAAARNSTNPASIAAARSAGHAAATAHCPKHAHYAAIYAAKASTNANAELEWQWQQLPEHLKPILQHFNSSKKMANSCSTYEEYRQNFSTEVQTILDDIRQTIRKAAPDAIEGISYGMPTYKTHGKPLVYFAAFKNHIGFYATPTGHLAFKEELSKYKQGKGSVQFPLDFPMPLDLIDSITRFRVEENQYKSDFRESKT